MSVREVASAEFYQLSRRTEGKLVVAQFTATWCGPCRRVAPQYEALARRTPEVEFIKVRLFLAACRLSTHASPSDWFGTVVFTIAVHTCWNCGHACSRCCCCCCAPTELNVPSRAQGTSAGDFIMPKFSPVVGP